MTHELEVYQGKEAEWVENQAKVSEAIDVAENIVAGLQGADGAGLEQVETTIPWLSRLNKAIK